MKKKQIVACRKLLISVWVCAEHTRGFYFLGDL